MYSEDDFLSLSGIQHFSFCRRQWALIHIAQIWSDNYLTFRGNVNHTIAHDDSRKEKRKNTLISRGLQVRSLELGVSGECDVVEFHRSNTGAVVYGAEGYYRLIPIEYKSGSIKDLEADQLQLTAEALCLEEMFCVPIEKGYLYYKKSNKRCEVRFDDGLRNKAKSMFLEMHKYFDQDYIPKVRKTNACKSCSLLNECGVLIYSAPDPENYLKVRFKDFDDA